MVGNQVPRYSGWKRGGVELFTSGEAHVGNQVPRYSGLKLFMSNPFQGTNTVGNQVPRYSGLKQGACQGAEETFFVLETKYRDIAD